MGAAKEELQIGVQLGQGSASKKKKKKRWGLVEHLVSMRGHMLVLILPPPPKLDELSSTHVRHLKTPLLLIMVTLL